MLLANIHPAFSQSIDERVLVDLLTMAVPQKPMGSERRFPDRRAEIVNLVFIHEPKF